MREIKICIIDESVEVNKLEDFFSNIPPINIVPYGESQNISGISHGTICLAILLEALKEEKLIGKVSLTHYSVTENREPRTYRALINALQYCVQNRMDIVSISIGVMNRVFAKEINRIISSTDETLIVAAASNDGKLTYPAALPCVLGVKSSFLKSVPRYSIADNPSDGVEVIANLPKSSVMEKMEKQHIFLSEYSNSFIVPQVCAKIVSESLAKERRATKELAINWLYGDVRSRKKSYKFSQAQTVEDDKIPIIQLECKGQITAKVLSRAKKIKSRFDSLLYPCSLVAETIVTDDFIQGIYQLDTTLAADCIGYYQYVVSDSLILVLSRSETILAYPFDFVFSDWIDLKISEICNLILQKFQERDYIEESR